MTVHANLTDPELHEPKGAAAASANTVYVADGAGAGSFQSQSWANLTARKETLTVRIEDISTAGQSYIVSPFSGTVTKLYSVINGAISGSDATLTSKIGGVAITDGAITVAQSDSAAGDVDSVTPSADNTISAGSAIEIETDGASTGTVECFITIEITLS